MAAFFDPAGFTTHRLEKDSKLLVCHACGALVPARSKNPHRNFHKAIKRLQDEQLRLINKLRQLAR